MSDLPGVAKGEHPDPAYAMVPGRHSWFAAFRRSKLRLYGVSLGGLHFLWRFVDLESSPDLYRRGFPQNIQAGVRRHPRPALFNLIVLAPNGDGDARVPVRTRERTGDQQPVAVLKAFHLVRQGGFETDLFRAPAMEGPENSP